jgi:hypothetical protein
VLQHATTEGSLLIACPRGRSLPHRAAVLTIHFPEIPVQVRYCPFARAVQRPVGLKIGTKTAGRSCLLLSVRGQPHGWQQPKQFGPQAKQQSQLTAQRRSSARRLRGWGSMPFRVELDFTPDAV